MRVSIVVPTLNEARTIVESLARLQVARAAGTEVIVVDGGSSDATVPLASPHADRVVTSARGRASQMNAGAAIAGGGVLLFLHADSHLPENGAAAIVRDMRRSGRQWGRFDVEIAGRAPILKFVAALMNLRSRVTGIATGDQGIFVEKRLFESVGGFPDQPLMEDIEICRRLKRAGGPPLCLTNHIVTSGRRWERNGPLRTIAAMWRWRFDYWRGVDPARIAAEYDSGRTHVTLQVFAKIPVAGQVKTRLAQSIGDAEAASLHASLVERTLETAASARDAGIVDQVELWCSPDIDAPECSRWRDRYRVALKVQIGDDLGIRMRNALSSAIRSGSRALLIGGDCPGIDVSYLTQAAAALDGHDVVVGPAEDGGYVLIGMRTLIDAFSGIQWSTSTVMAETRARLLVKGAIWKELPVLWDVDEPADLRRWNAMLTKMSSAR